ncbi:hypothetical protein PZC41_14135, partial [Staphylococcus aureus]|uniref:LamG-like jellyroll fold domain-containing protein n=1 Tax=Staphylococcus aureus TaxID=1280 RepID=UPI0023B1E57D
MTVALTNMQLVSWLRAHFPSHDLYAQDAYARALQFALTRPGLIGAWGGVVNIATPELVDVSGNGVHLAFRDNAALALDSNRPFMPFITLDGTGDYMSRTDEAKLDILGTSTALVSALRGLTFSAWVRFDNTASATENVGSKWNTTGNQRSWQLLRTSGGNLQANISNLGTGTNAAATSTATIAANTWTHTVFTFQPSAAVRNYINGLQDGADTSGVPASLFNSSAALVLGGDGAAANLMTGDIALPWLTASLTSADLIFYYYHMTRR